MKLEDIKVGEILVHTGLGWIKKVTGVLSNMVVLEDKNIALSCLHMVRPANAVELLEHRIKEYAHADQANLLLKILQDAGPEGVRLRCACSSYVPVDQRYPELGNKTCQCFALLQMSPRGDLMTRHKDFLLNEVGYPINVVKKNGIDYYVLLNPEPLPIEHELWKECKKSAKARLE